MIWPDWTNESVAIVASGASVEPKQVACLKNRMRVIAIKKNIELAPFADVVYGCDGPWWRSVQFLPKFTGLKLSFEPTVCNAETGIAKVEIPDKHGDRLLFDRVGVVGSGGNSGFQALNLAAQFGAARILLIGFDMQGEHWYGRNNWGQSNNPGPWNFPRWIAAFRNASVELMARNVDVVNASPISQIKGFRKQSVEETLRLWNLADAA